MKNERCENKELRNSYDYTRPLHPWGTSHIYITLHLKREWKKKKFSLASAKPALPTRAPVHPPAHSVTPLTHPHRPTRAAARARSSHTSAQRQQTNPCSSSSLFMSASSCLRCVAACVCVYLRACIFWFACVSLPCACVCICAQTRVFFPMFLSFVRVTAHFQGRKSAAVAF